MIAEQIFPDEAMNRKAYDETQKYMERTLEALEICEKCPDCYNLHRPMTNVCRLPHILLWVPLAGFNYSPAKLPAKLISVEENSRRLDVAFFGDYKVATIAPKSVYLFSWQFPDKGLPPTSSLYPTFLTAWNVSDTTVQLLGTIHTKNVFECNLTILLNFRFILQEIRTHISYIRHEFGVFNAAELREPFKIKDFQKHYTDMFGSAERVELQLNVGYNDPTVSSIVKDDDKFPYVMQMQQKLYGLEVTSE